VVYPYKSRVLERLGLRSWINASNWSTTLGGTWLAQEVLDAMDEVAKTFVPMDELLDTAGRRVAELCHVDAAHVTCGAAAGIELSVAACMTGKDTRLQLQLPHTAGMRNEVVMPRGHANHYTPNWYASGARIVEYGWSGYLRLRGNEIDDAITERTCCLGYVHSYHCTPRGEIPIDDVVRVAHRHELPVVVDTASMLPPVSNLHRFADAGVDISIFSGGKGIRGPNDTGLILGKGERGKELIEAIRMFSCPHGGWGRALKVSKEQIVGLVTALEIFVREGDAWYDQQMATCRYLVDVLSGIPNVSVHIIPNDATYHEHPVYPHVPRVVVEWDAGTLGLSPADVDTAMAAEDPPIVLRRGIYSNIYRNKAWRLIDTYYLREGEEQIVAERLRRVLTR
jgi:L-seryl-tRNA(Ser) seleniumtransferase